MLDIIKAIVELLDAIVGILLTRGFLTNGESTKLKIKSHNMHEAIDRYDSNGS
jgi:hypothetical protein